ncbi:MAG: PorV/PorQ family protein [Bacteroidia bacterium]|nr:PorV/PorQ family protein [Bacteroidia bacterium]
MKKYFILSIILIGGYTLTTAQNERIGQAGATELLINSMPKSSGFNGLDLGSTSGIEGSLVNPAGIARTTGTELMFARTAWLRGSEIFINSFGFSQSVGVDGGTIGLLINTVNLGEFVRTTVDQPDGTLGTFSPTFLNIGLSFAKKFTDQIHVGATVRVINQSTPEVSANGVAFDAGVQYRNGEKDRLKLGIALRNVGPTMQFGGDGLAGRVTFESNKPYDTGVELPTARFEIPTVLSMGGSYDFFLGTDNTITAMGAFISNSFYNNQGGLGLEYSYKDIVMLRGSFLYENGIFDELGRGRNNAHTGGALGASFQIPFGSGKYDASGNEAFSAFSLDMSYRFTNPFDGTFTFGARIDI